MSSLIDFLLFQFSWQVFDEDTDFLKKSIIREQKSTYFILK